jgi:hypothetical protein
MCMKAPPEPLALSEPKHAFNTVRNNKTTFNWVEKNRNNIRLSQIE